MASRRRRLYFPNVCAARNEVVIALNALLVLSKFRFIVSKEEVAALQKRYRAHMSPDLPRDLLDDIINLVYTVFRKKIWWLFIPKYFFDIKQDHTFDDTGYAGKAYLSDAYSKAYLRAKLFKALRCSGIGRYRN